MPSDTLKYAMGIILLILTGGFFLALSGREVPAFMMEIALTLPIAIAIKMSHETANPRGK